MRSKLVFALAMALSLSQCQPCVCSELYQEKIKEFLEVQSDAAGGTDLDSGTDLAENGGYDVPQADMQLVERKITSPALSNAVVGRTIVPENWDIKVTDLMIGTESITCPNAVWVTISDPEGKCELTFISRREFEEKSMNLMGYITHTEDDVYDLSGMMHTLDYREADEACDLMAKILYGDGLSCIGKKEYSEEELDNLQKARDDYHTFIQEKVRKAGGEKSGENLSWTDVTAAQKTYVSGNDKITVNLLSAGYQLDNDFSGTHTIFWAMPAVCAIKTSAQAHDEYQELFSVFCQFTSVSQEYEQLRSQNSQKLVQEFTKAWNSGVTYYPSAESWENNEDATVNSGDTYSSADAWDDYIRGETDYTTGDGSHIKISNDYDHVFEGDNGNIYAGSSADGPAGSEELDPTRIGD